MGLFTADRTKRQMFAKNPDQPPFFSLHPKTKVGMIIRIALSAFIIASLALTLLARAGLLFLWYYKLYYLVYIVPAFGIIALIIVGLVKRMSIMILKIGIPAILGLLSITVLLSISSMMAYTSDFGPSPKMTIARDGHTLVIMRSCDGEPTHIEYVTNADGTVSEIPKYLRRADAFKYAVRVPNEVEGEKYTIEGELYAPDGVNIKSEWLDERTLRVYIASDATLIAYGELTVRFEPSETTMPASPDAGAQLEFLKTVTSEAGARSVSVYRERSFIDHAVDSPLSIEESDLKQYFVAYPSTLRIFARINTRVEGAIELERRGTLAGFNIETISEDVFKITPAEGSEGASGDITIYFKEKASKPNDNEPSDAATPSEYEDATPSEQP